MSKLQRASGVSASVSDHRACGSDWKFAVLLRALVVVQLLLVFEYLETGTTAIKGA